MISDTATQQTNLNTEKTETMAGLDFLCEEARLGSRVAFENYLNAVPDVPPQDDDRSEN